MIPRLTIWQFIFLVASLIGAFWIGISRLDRRIDDLNHKLDARFEEVDKRFDDMNKRMDERFDDMNKRIDDLRQVVLAQQKR